MKADPVDMLKALAVETRVKIIDLLKKEGPLGAKRISEMLGVTPAAISQHLKVLKQAGFVRSERNGYWIPYSIDEETMDACRQTLTDICTCGCQETGTIVKKERIGTSLDALKRYEQALEKELKAVRMRISGLETANR